MSRCRRFEERFLIPADEWRDHQRTCPDCATQERAHRILRRDLAAEVPTLPPGFHRRVTAAAGRRSRRGLDVAWRRRLMAAYWLTAAVAALLLVTPSWPASLDAMDWIVLGGSLLVLALPTMILRALLRADLVEIWFRTVD